MEDTFTSEETDDGRKYGMNALEGVYGASGFRSTADVWSGRIVLSLDGDMLTSLLILERLVEEILILEQKTPCAHSSSFSPIFQPSLLDFEGVANVSKPGTPHERQYLLCHYFDYITGTGVSGISAVLLSTMHRSVGETLQRTIDIWRDMIPCYPKLSIQKSTKTGNSKRFRDHLQVVLSDLYSEIQEQAFPSTTLNTTYQPCQTIILATQDASKGVTRPYVFRSHQGDFLGYLLREASLHPQEVSLWDAVCAASAAPNFCSKVKVEGLTGKFRDVSVWSTDPTNEIYREVRALHTDMETPVEALLSIGSTSKRDIPWRLGSRGCNRSAFARKDADKALRKLATQEGFMYERVETHLACETEVVSNEAVERLRQEIKGFCELPEQRSKILAWASFLVTTRRLRARTVQWERFAELKVKCRLCSQGTTSLDRRSLTSHFRNAHKIDPMLLEAFERSCHTDMTFR